MFFISKHISVILKSLSDKPGVYRFLDEHGKIIYIGKAKNLRKRVNSYFNKKHTDGKLQVLVPKICDIQPIVVDTEWEALLLENNMIKEFRPRYNVLLKDNKTYPWIAITKEKFPRIYYTRKPQKSHEDIFGPYPYVRFMHILLETIFDNFPLRSCQILNRHNRPCLKYHIKRCSAPCANLISQEEYMDYVKKATEIIKGNNSVVIKQLKQEMMALAEEWEFEKAQVLKEKIANLESYQGKSTVVNPQISNCDVFSIAEDEDTAYIHFLRIVEGAIIQSYTLEIKYNLEKNRKEMLLMGLAEIENRFGALSREVIVPLIPDLKPENLTYTLPKRGEKLKLLELANKNLKFYILEKKKRLELIDPERYQGLVLEKLKSDLGMQILPRHIECFDNSNTQGDEAVSAMVCFINGKPEKKEYRHYNIVTVVGANDFATMEEVIFRRYSRVLEEQKPLPDLIIVDGGKGQLSAAQDALNKLPLNKDIMMIGIAERLEDIYKVGEKFPLYIDKKSESQKLLQYIRNEAHRFGIEHHRKRRAKKSIASELDTIKGIGKITKEKLLLHFKSTKRLKEASLNEIAAIVGKSKALLIEKQKMRV